MLKELPINFGKIVKIINELIKQFNAAEPEDHIKRIFCLQKINYHLNNQTTDDSLYTWLVNPQKEGWQSNLAAYGISPMASFFLKGIQFAQAVAQYYPDAEQSENPTEDYFQLVQARDELLAIPEFDETNLQSYIPLNLKTVWLAEHDETLIKRIKIHKDNLEIADFKLKSIQEQSTAEPTRSYKTEPLGKKANNYICKLTIGGAKEPFILRVEERNNLRSEQKLQSHPVSRLFNEDYAVFMMAFKGEELITEYKPVTLSQLASQGSLHDIATGLKGENHRFIASQAKWYFSKLIDFCNQLMAAGAYHPDIKLTNLLVHKYRIVVSDRKAILTTDHAKIRDILSTEAYAPDEFNSCLKHEKTAEGEYLVYFNPDKLDQVVALIPYMYYQVGMALKEFLILSQTEELTDDFGKSHVGAADSFQAPNAAIQNLSLLAQELTRAEPEKRLTIQQFQRLLAHTNSPPEQFYEQVENELPSAELGIADEVEGMKSLINSGDTGEKLLKQANQFFNKIISSQPIDTRITRLATKLTSMCMNNGSRDYFVKLSATLEKTLSDESELLNQDWKKAPWYRKALHVLTFGYYRVERLTDISNIDIGYDVQGDEFQLHFPQLHFLDLATLNLSEEAQDNFNLFINNYVETSIPDDSASEKDVPAPSSIKDYSSASCNSLEDQPLDSGSIQFDPTAEDSALPDAFLAHVANFKNTDSISEHRDVDYDTGPRLVSGTSAEESTPFKPGFFEGNSRRPNRNSVRTALFLGDGSHREKKSTPKVPVEHINWTWRQTPPTDEEQSTNSDSSPSC